jgi:hypothetical protein
LIHHGKRSPEEGAELLDRTLRVIEGAWPDFDENSAVSRFDGRLIEALSEVLARNPNIDTQRMAKRLGSRQAVQWINNALDTRAGPLRDRMAHVMLAAYNKSLPSSRHAGW